MRIARTAATLAIVLATTGCGVMPTEPGRDDVQQKTGRSEMASPESSVSRKSGNTVGSGS